MNLEIEHYESQRRRWPGRGRHILAQFDEDSIVVYQAYRPEIGVFAAEHGYFGGPFSYGRMSWIKPNFLWMMYRSGWATKPGQETVLAVRLRREGFDEILRRAVPSTFTPRFYPDQAAWSQAARDSDVRLQWDPDHDPVGQKVERRAIQLGLRDDALRSYGREWIVSIEDITEFVHEQHAFVRTRNLAGLVIPREEVYPVAEASMAILQSE